MKIILRSFAIALIFLGVSLSIVNIYGLNRDIRPAITPSELRFKNDLNLNYEQAMQALQRKPNENDFEYSERVTFVIADSLAHIEWNDEYDLTRYNQLIPFWENYILHLMGVLTPIPEYQRYHFADYKRSLERGIGICGDASMIMSQVLGKEKIASQIVSFPGHVVLAATYPDGTEKMYDADFGVHVPYSINEINQSPHLVRPYYLEQGFSKREINTLVRAYSKKFERWNGVKHFITKKYYFEYVSYWVKWLFPLLCMLMGFLILNKNKQQTDSSLNIVD